MDNGNLLETSEQYLQQLKYELENDETCAGSDEQQDDNLLRVKNDVQRCYEKIVEEKSEIIKHQMDKNNQVMISYQQLSMKHNELICKLENSENNVRHLQKEICVLQDKKSKLVKEIKEKEKLRAICEGDVCKMRCKLEGCSNDNEQMTKHIATLESDLRCKTSELGDERLCVKKLKDTMEKHQEERLAIEWKLKCCQLKQEAYANKECEPVRCCSNVEKLPKCCCSPIDDELCCLKKKNKELQIEIDHKNTIINVQKNKYNEAKCILKKIKLSLENSYKEKLNSLCMENLKLKEMKKTQEKICKLKCKIPCCTTKIFEKQADVGICCTQSYSKSSTPCCKSLKCTCKMSICTCLPSPSCCNTRTQCCDSLKCTCATSVCTCKTSACTCKTITCTCKPNPPCCKTSTPCCESIKCTCKTTTITCKPKPNSPCCKTSTPCCKSIKCTCKTITCTCKPSPPCCKTSTPCCESIKCTCKTTTITCKPKPSSPCCKPSTPCCKSIECTCKTITCTCKPNPPCCKTSTPCCESIKCTCKTTTITCKPKPSSPCCNPSTPCCKSIECTCKTSTCTCKTITCTCKPNPPCCKTSTPCCESIKRTCKTTKITCKPKPNSPCCKPSTPCCKSIECTCKMSTCTCKTSSCICKLSPPSCEPSPPHCKSSLCSNSCENTLPPNKCQKFITDENRYVTELHKTLVELKNLKSDLQQLSKIK